MQLLAGMGAVLLIIAILWEAFETVILPRRVNRRWRLTVFFYRYTWHVWAVIGRRLRGRHNTFLSIYGPLSLLVLLGVWAAGLIFGFGVLQWALGSHVASAVGRHGLGPDLYMSGTTFFTLGLGDVTPNTTAARLVTVIEAGTGFGFLALVITYLPVLYQAFSRREVQISLLDARAGSPPSGMELVRRIGNQDGMVAIIPLLEDWEVWSAELLESSLSYPSLAYFRSQHDNQSWLAALTAIMDVCSLLLVGIDGVPAWRARVTFGIARHAAVDLCQYLNAPPHKPVPDRLPAADRAHLRQILAANGVPLRGGAMADEKLAELRHLYEPFVNGLAHRLVLTLPPWLPAPDAKDNWQTTAWDDVI